MSLISWGHIGRGEFFPLKSLWYFLKHLATFGGFHFLFGLGAFIAPLCVSLVLRHTDDAVQARLGGSIGATERGGFAGGHSGKPPTIMAGQPTPAKVPPSEIRV